MKHGEDAVDILFLKSYAVVLDCDLKAIRAIAGTVDSLKHYWVGNTTSNRQTHSLSAEKRLERQGRNNPIQGTCGDIVKTALLYLHESLWEYDAQVIHQVHDEIVIEVKEDQADAVRGIVEADMVRAGQVYIKSIPVVVDIHVDVV